MFSVYETRPASPKDVRELIKLRKLTMVEHLEASGFELSESAHSNCVLYQFDSTRIVHCNGRDIGMVKVVRGGSIWELIQIQILPACQSRGIATRVIKDLLADGNQNSVRVSLCVLKTNLA